MVAFVVFHPRDYPFSKTGIVLFSCHHFFYRSPQTNSSLPLEKANVVYANKEQSVLGQATRLSNLLTDKSRDIYLEVLFTVTNEYK